MTDRRIIEIHERPARVRFDTGCLVLEHGTGENTASTSVAVRDVDALILSHPQISISGAALSAVAEAGGIVVISGDDALPRGMLLPFGHHHAPARRLAAQAAATQPVLKRLWAEIVSEKIRGQAVVLARNGEEAGHLFGLANNVRSGDPDNIEGQAARYYWLRLFDDGFVRDREAPDANRLLNYGYAILRAFVTRALCAAGLHPGLGLHHHHRNNPFPLADDVMEPFRPVVDQEVVALVEAAGHRQPLDGATRRRLVAVIARNEFNFGKEKCVPAEYITQLAQRLAKVFEDERKDMGVEGLWHP